MNLDRATVVMRQRGLAEVLDLASLFVFSAGLGLYLRLAAIVLLPSFALTLALRYWLDWHPAWVWIVALSLATPLQGVFTIAAGRMMFSESLTVGEVMRAYASRLGAYAGALVASRFIMALSCMFIVTLPLGWAPMVFVHEACLLEQASAMESTGRSSRIGQARGTGAFEVLLGLLATQAGILLGVELLAGAFVEHVLQLGAPFGKLFQQGISPYALLGFFLSVPYVATARFLAYIDARTRSDGWDIQLRFMAIAARALEQKGRV